MGWSALAFAERTKSRRRLSRVVDAMRSALKKAGVMFIAENGGGTGVGLKRASEADHS